MMRIQRDTVARHRCAHCRLPDGLPLRLTTRLLPTKALDPHIAWPQRTRRRATPNLGLGIAQEPAVICVVVSRQSSRRQVMGVVGATSRGYTSTALRAKSCK